MAHNLARAVEVARPFLQAAGLTIDHNKLVPPATVHPPSAGAE
jgi:hypothetical protein